MDEHSSFSNNAYHIQTIYEKNFAKQKQIIYFLEDLNYCSYCYSNNISCIDENNHIKDIS